ncbi:MAG: insulinase family protein, partial [Vicinamibacterales bacterium]|nr:insulinase family protein [Vicinamibacterales bacterium]
ALLPGSTAAQPAPAASPGAPRALEIPYTHFTLPNGLHVILHQDRSVPIVSVNVWYHVGSGSEKVGRTGFAHLFEHLMFEGSKHVPEGAFDEWLEAAGASNNGSTNTDRTNYFIDGPTSALELALFLDSDRMAYLLDTMSPAKVDGQRDVVKNERRQGVENRPYGLADVTLSELLFPKEHPYHWSTIGYMEDLTAASHEDVVEFFRKYYAPNNASLVIAGDIDLAATRALVEKWFAEVKRGEPVLPVAPPPAMLTGVVRKTMTDRVQLPRLTLAWITPRHFAPGDAELDLAAQVLAGGKNSRLYKRLVYDLQIAQDVSAVQDSAALASTFVIEVMVRPQPGVAARDLVAKVQSLVDEELDRLRAEPPSEREIERARNQVEAGFYASLERVGGFGGRANRLNAYYVATGNPDYVNEDLARYRAVSAGDVQAAITRFLPRDRRVELVVEPASEEKQQ